LIKVEEEEMVDYKACSKEHDVLLLRADAETQALETGGNPGKANNPGKPDQQLAHRNNHISYR
jgi:hypothetical protein